MLWSTASSSHSCASLCRSSHLNVWGSCSCGPVLPIKTRLPNKRFGTETSLVCWSTRISTVWMSSVSTSGKRNASNVARKLQKQGLGSLRLKHKRAARIYRLQPRFRMMAQKQQMFQICPKYREAKSHRGPPAWTARAPSRVQAPLRNSQMLRQTRTRVRERGGTHQPEEHQPAQPSGNSSRRIRGGATGVPMSNRDHLAVCETRDTHIRIHTYTSDTSIHTCRHRFSSPHTCVCCKHFFLKSTKILVVLVGEICLCFTRGSTIIVA